MPTLYICSVSSCLVDTRDTKIRKDDNYHHRLVSFAEQNLNLYAGSYTPFSIKQAMINLFKFKCGEGGRTTVEWEKTNYIYI